MKWPKNVDFDVPEAEGLSGAKNFYLPTEQGVKIGVWHVLPREGGREEATDKRS